MSIASIQAISLLPSQEKSQGFHVQKTMNVASVCTAIAWSVDGTKIAGLSDFGQRITIWNTNGKVLNILERKPKEPYIGNSLDFLKDDELLTPPAANNTPLDEGYSLSVWNILNGAIIKNVRGSRPEQDWHYNWAEIFATSPDRSLVAVVMPGSFKPPSVAIYSTRTWQILRTIPLGSKVDFVESIALAQGDGYLAAGMATGKVFLVDLHSGNILRILNVDPNADIPALAFNSNGDLLATAAGLHVIHYDPPDAGMKPSEPAYAAQIWRVADGTRIASYPVGDDEKFKLTPIRKMVWSPSGVLAFTAADATVRLWLPSSTGRTMRIKEDALSIVFSPEGNELAVCGSQHVSLFGVHDM